MNNRLTLLITGDIILSFLSVYSGFGLRFCYIPEPHEIIAREGARALIYSAVLIFSSFFLELYSKENNYSKKVIFLRITIAILTSFVMLSALYYILPAFRFWRGTLLLSLGSFGILQLLWHISYKLCLNLPGFASRVLVLGTGPLADHIGRIIQSMNPQYVLAGYINCASEPVLVPADHVVGNGKGLLETVKNIKAHKIVVSLTEQRGNIPMKDVLDCKLNGVEVLDAPSFYERITGKLLIENIKPSWFIYSDGFKITTLTRFRKRAFDLFFALLGLMITIPFFPVLAFLIKIDSRGPVFFKQTRVGQGEKNFVLYKFRTMRQDAESHTGAVWAQKNDPRVTRVGAFLRKTRIDEIPQLINVLRGHMSFVGPRPERPEFVSKLKDIIPYYSERHSVKPGVTGWAQVKYPYGASVEDAIEKLRYDLYYIKNLSFFLDMLIVLETIKVVIFGRGSR